jgi:hypothetical protein
LKREDGCEREKRKDNAEALRARRFAERIADLAKAGWIECQAAFAVDVCARTVGNRPGGGNWLRAGLPPTAGLG